MKLDRIVAAALALAISLSGGLAAAAAKPAPTGKVNINSASVEQLSALPGVGAKLAARIVEHRQKSGAFKSVQELMNVRGIGEKNFEKLQPYLTTGESAKTGDTAKAGGTR
jgi:comEA protein